MEISIAAETCNWKTYMATSSQLTTAWHLLEFGRNQFGHL